MLTAKEAYDKVMANLETRINESKELIEKAITKAVNNNQFDCDVDYIPLEVKDMIKEYLENLGYKVSFESGYDDDITVIISWRSGKD